MLDFKHKKHLFFDLDHTLWDFDKNSSFAFDSIFKEQGYEINLNDFLEVYKKDLKEMPQENLKGLSFTFIEHFDEVLTAAFEKKTMRKKT